MAEYKLDERKALEILKNVAAEHVPNTLDEAMQLMFEIDMLAREEAALTADAEARMAEVYREVTPRVQAKQRAAYERVCRVYAFARANRSALTNQNETKTVELGPAGTTSWRTAPTSLDVTDESTAIANIIKRGLESEFVRSETVRSLIKDTLKQQPEVAQTIPGLSLEADHEMFYLRTADPMKGVKGKAKKLAEKVAATPADDASTAPEDTPATPGQKMAPSARERIPAKTLPRKAR